MQTVGFASGIVDAILFIVVILLILLLPFIIAGFVYFLIRRNNRNRAAWAQAAGALGLHMPNPKLLDLRGEGTNSKVRIAVGIRTSGAQEERRSEHFTYARATLEQPLRFLLEINRRGGILSKKSPISLGQENFDKAFSLKCYDASVARNLLLSDFPSTNTQNLMGDIMLAEKHFKRVDITDAHVYLETSGHTSDVDEIRRLFESARDIADRFVEARKLYPLAEWEKTLLKEWEAVAKSMGLQLFADRFEIQGKIDSRFPVRVKLGTLNGKWQTELALRFPKSIQAGLNIMPEHKIHKALSWLGAQDIESGIKEFDDAFVVKAKNVQAASNLLTPDLAKHLLHLNSGSAHVNVNDEEITVRYETVIGDRRRLGSLLTSMRDVALILLR